MTVTLSVLIGLAALLEISLGVRLVALSFKTGGRAERYWGMTWLLDAAAQVTAALSSPEQDWLMALSSLLTCASTLCLALGVWLVFRFEERWIPGLIFLYAVVIAGFFIWVAATGTFITELGRESPFMRWPNRIAIWLTLLWAVFECRMAYSDGKRQLTLGLGDRFNLVRFSLWGVAATSLALFVSMLMAQDLFGFSATILRVVHLSLALTAVSTMWLTFFPTESMRIRFTRPSA